MGRCFRRKVYFGGVFVNIFLLFDGSMLNVVSLCYGISW